MSDRELLEDAAKAAGVALYWSDDDPECDWVQGTYPRIPDYKVLEKWTWAVWNPLTDDGDALRLMVRLAILPTLAIDFRISNGATWWARQESEGVVYWSHEPHGTDPLAATRRAIVRAAAEIGRSMK